MYLFHHCYSDFVFELTSDFLLWIIMVIVVTQLIKPHAGIWGARYFVLVFGCMCFKIFESQPCHMESTWIVFRRRINMWGMKLDSEILLNCSQPWCHHCWYQWFFKSKTLQSSKKFFCNDLVTCKHMAFTHIHACMHASTVMHRSIL